MSELKTKPTSASVAAFLDAVEDVEKRRDCQTIAAMMQEATGKPPVMWGASIVGFGAYHYRSSSGQEGDWPLTGFSPRKQSLSLYIMSGFDKYQDLLARLGKHKLGKGCLYINRLSDVDVPTLRQLIQRSVKDMIKAHGQL